MIKLKEAIFNFFFSGIYTFILYVLYGEITEDPFLLNIFLNKSVENDIISLSIIQFFVITPISLSLNSHLITNEYKKEPKILKYSQIINIVLHLTTSYFSMFVHNVYLLILYTITLILLILRSKPIHKVNNTYLVLFVAVYVIIYIAAILGLIPQLNISIKNTEIHYIPKEVTEKTYKFDLSNRNFVNGNFTSLTFLDCNFDNCNLKGAIFNSCKLSDEVPGQIPHFKNSNLEQASFKGSYLYYADFSGANLKNTDFSNAYLEGAHFDNADLTKCKGLNIEQLNNTSLIDAYLPQFVLDSIKSNPRQYKILIRENVHYKNYLN